MPALVKWVRAYGLGSLRALLVAVAVEKLKSQRNSANNKRSYRNQDIHIVLLILVLEVNFLKFIVENACTPMRSLAA